MHHPTLQETNSNDYKYQQRLYPVSRRLKTIVENLLKVLKSWELLFFPKRCFGCGRNEEYICSYCVSKIKFLNEIPCLVCQKPAVGGFTHSLCRNRFSPERLVSAFGYEGVVKKVLVNCKYRKKAFSAYGVLCRLTFEHFNELGLDFGDKAVIVPIPVSLKKYHERSFSHTEIIAEHFAKNYGLKILNCLEKIKETPSQSLLKKEQRKANVHNVFRIKRGLKEKLVGKDVILIDDIVTTGSTMLSACSALKADSKFFPRYIYCISLAFDEKKKM